MNLIVAVDKNWGIGKDNELLYYLPKDLEFFKTKTLNKVVVMGENTFKSLPNAKPLKNRTNIVLSKNQNLKIEGAIVVNTTDELFNLLKTYNSDDVFIIGGQMIYELLLPYCTYAYITKINFSSPATKFFPNINKQKNWEMVFESQPVEDGEFTISFTTYKNNCPKKF